jgi:hypothetical protein
LLTCTPILLAPTGPVDYLSNGFMKGKFLATFAIVSILLSSEVGAASERTLSTSRQFILYGTDVGLRGAISHVAEETKTNLLSILRRSDSWKTPIVINLQFPQANVPEIPPAQLRFSQTGAGLKLQLDLTISSDFNSAAIERELLRAILLELIYRQQPDLAPGTAYVDPPDWLLDGIVAVRPGRDPKQLVEALEPLIATDKIAPLEGFLRQRPAFLDASARFLFRAYSAALVRWLVDGPEGRLHLGQYIDNLSRASNDPLADLKTYFSALNGDSAEMTWRFRVGRFCDAQGYQLLTFAETERRLDELLSIKLAEAKSPSNGVSALQDLTGKKISADQSKALVQLGASLTLLQMRAHPILRPIVTEYEQICYLLANRKKSAANERLQRVQTLRLRIASRMSKIDDYMNWFEATQARTTSDAFADYLNAVEAQSEIAPRRDALSVYMDAVEGQIQD